jgi:hypothetical protein
MTGFNFLSIAALSPHAPQVLPLRMTAAFGAELTHLRVVASSPLRVRVAAKSGKHTMLLTIYRSSMGQREIELHRSIESLPHLDRVRPKTRMIDGSGEVFRYGWVVSESGDAGAVSDTNPDGNATTQEYYQCLAKILHRVHSHRMPGFGHLAGPYLDLEEHARITMSTASVQAARLSSEVPIPFDLMARLEGCRDILHDIGKLLKPVVINGSVLARSIDVNVLSWNTVRLEGGQLILTDWSRARADWWVMDYSMMLIERDAHFGGESTGHSETFNLHAFLDFYGNGGLSAADLRSFEWALRLIVYLRKFQYLQQTGQLREVRNVLIPFLQFCSNIEA